MRSALVILSSLTTLLGGCFFRCADRGAGPDMTVSFAATINGQPARAVYTAPAWPHGGWRSEDITTEELDANGSIELANVEGGAGCGSDAEPALVTDLVFLVKQGNELSKLICVPAGNGEFSCEQESGNAQIDAIAVSALPISRR